MALLDRRVHGAPLAWPAIADVALGPHCSVRQRRRGTLSLIVAIGSDLDDRGDLGRDGRAAAVAVNGNEELTGVHGEMPTEHITTRGRHQEREQSTANSPRR